MLAPEAAKAIALNIYCGFSSPGQNFSFPIILMM